METEIAQGPIGTVGAYDVDFKDGKLTAKVNAGSDVVKADLTVELDAGVVLDKLAKAIPGTFDDAIIALAKTALGCKTA